MLGFMAFMESSMLFSFVCFLLWCMAFFIGWLVDGLYGVAGTFQSWDRDLSSPLFGVFGFWFFDLGVLGIIGLTLCFLPVGYRWCMRVFSGVSGGKKWRELVFRWTGDVYEVGVSISDGNLRGFHSLSPGMVGGMSGVWSWGMLFLWGDLCVCIFLGCVC